jgi:hypothetical protein
MGDGNDPRRALREVAGAIELEHRALGRRWLQCDGSPELIFTENETNFHRLFGAQNSSPYVKDGINEYVVNGAPGLVNSAHTGTKARPDL